MARNLQPDYIKWVLELNTDQAQGEFYKLTKANRELEKQNREKRRQMAALAAQGKKNTQEYRNLQRAITQTNSTIADNKAKMALLSRQFDLSSMTLRQLRNHLKNLKRQLEDTQRSADPKAYKELQQQIAATQQAIREANTTTKSWWQTLKDNSIEILKGSLLSIGDNILRGVTSAFANLKNTVMEFSADNSRLAAILGTTKDGIVSLTEQAKELGRTTTATASQVTNLQIELAKLGFTQKQIEDMSPAVLKFSKAVGTDLASAAAFAGASLRIFGKDSAETESTLATLAISTSKSALDFAKLQSSMSTIGPVAASFGLSLEDTTALLGTLANAGFDASSAATATRNILLNLCDANGKLAKALGSPVTNLDELATALDKLSAEGVDLAKVLEMTDKESVSAFSSFLKQSKSMITLRDSISGVNKEFGEMAQTMDDNAKGAEAGFESAVEGLILRFGGLDEIIKFVYNTGTKFVELIGWIIDLFNPLTELVKTVAGWFSTLGKYIASMTASLGITEKTTKTLNNTLKFLKSVLSGLVSGFALYKAATLASIAVTKLKTSALLADIKATIKAKSVTELFNNTLKKNPILGVISLILGLTMALKEYFGTAEDAEEATDKLREAEEREAEILEAHRKARENFNDNLETEKRKILDLVSIAKDETKSKEERLRAIKQLNALCPEYNGHLDAEKGKLIANKKALDEYIKSMEKRMRIAYYKDEYQKYINEEEAARRRARKAVAEFNEHRNEIVTREETTRHGKPIPGTDIYPFSKTTTRTMRRGKDKQDPLTVEKDMAKEELARAKENTANLVKDMEESKISVLDFAETSEVATTKVAGGLGKVTQSARQTADSLKTMAESVSEQPKNLQDEMKEALDAANKANNEALKKSCDDRLDALDAFYKTQEQIIKQSVLEGKVTQGQADIYLLARERSNHEERLKVLLDYQEKVKVAASMSEEERKQALADFAAKIRDTQNQILTDTGKWAELMREATTNALSPEGLKETLDRQVAEISAYYDTLIAKVKEKGAETGDQAGTDDTVSQLEAEKNRRVAGLNYEYKEKMWGIKEQMGLSWIEEYKRELEALENLYKQGVIEKETFEKAKFNLAVKFAKKEFDYYSGMALSTFSALQDAEIAKSDAKYDVLIQQAKNNGEDTAALEQEKENKKLEIQKKYADVNFAIKISQIIADTAVSIMQAFSQLGPIGGAIAAVMLTATGVAQVISAKAERDKIKKMKPGNTGATGSVTKPASAERVLTGYSEGGYTGDGDRYEVAGVVHRGEYVVPKPIMKDRRVIDAVSMIEAIRAGGSGSHFADRAGGTRGHAGGSGSRYGAGFADGGYTGDPDGGGSLASELRQVVGEFREATHGLRAYVVYSDIEDAKKGIDRARAPFTR